MKNKHSFNQILILITLAMFIMVGCSSEKQEENTTNSIDNSVTAQETEIEETEEPEIVEEKDSALTVETNEDFASLMSSKDNNSLYLEFANQYKGQTIEFNAHIDYVTNHDKYDTRYDILLSGGDWVDENTVSPGPLFKIEDKNTYGLGLDGLYLPDWVKVGTNIKVTATIVKFNENAGFMAINPISISER